MATVYSDEFINVHIGKDYIIDLASKLFIFKYAKTNKYLDEGVYNLGV